tara:strand:- start:8244 stop:9974 length:1731 start_codon:yes stop_codon:yes gene_type:complete
MKKLLSILPKEENKNFIFFFVFVIIIIFLESLSIGAVFPLLMTILSENYESEKIYIFLIKYLNNLSYEKLILYLLLFVSFIFILKNLFIIYLQWWKHGFIYRIQFKLQRKFLEIYLLQLYLDTLKKNTGIKIRNITSETSRFAKYFIAIMTIVIESMVVFAVTLVLFYLNPKVAIAILSLISFLTLGFYIIAKIKTVKWSKLRLIHTGLAMKVLLESLSAIKELKIFNKEKLFLDEYSFQEKKALHLARLFSTFNDSPRVLIEAFMVVTLCISVIFMTNIGIEKKEILATLGIFAIAGFRLFPSTTRIIKSFNELKSNLPSIDLIIKELKLENKIQVNLNNENKILDLFNYIEFKNVNFKYPGKEQNVIENLNLKIENGSKIALLGESGSGKSTFSNLIIGFLKPDEGQVKIDGVDVFENFNQTKNLFSYVSQETFLLDESITYNVTFKKNLNETEKKKLIEIIDVVNLKDFINKLDYGFETIVGEKGVKISGGQKQRLTIARALFLNKKILILDEPTNELDEENEFEIIEKIFSKFKKNTIFLITHNKQLLKYCEKTLHFKNGKAELISANEKIL